jgi:F-type H+-transporting ATPase subunit epsilon
LANIRFEIVTAEKVIYSDEVDVVIAPGIEGELAILPNHAPLLTMLQVGELRLRKDGEETAIFVSGGFLEVMHNRVTILADTAERAEEIDIERAEEAKRLAEERLRTRPADIDLAQAEASLKRAMMRLRIAERKKRRPGSGGAEVL